MAIKRLFSDGTAGNYGQLELNRVVFPADGHIEATLPYVNTGSAPLENGMLVAVDHAKGEVRLPQADETCPIGIEYASEEIYNQFTPGLRYFAIKPNRDTLEGRTTDLEAHNFRPRVGMLKINDRFTTNTVCYDTDDFASEQLITKAIADAVAGTTPLYGGIDTTGCIKLSKTEPSVGPVLTVCKPVYGSKATMPDGSDAVFFTVKKA